MGIRPGPHPAPRPLASLGWALAGGLALSLSFPPVGFYPLAWAALVPILARWADRRASLALAREIYAVFLVAAAATGFWALHLPNTFQAALAGLGLLLVPVPMTLAFLAAAWVRQRYGLYIGLAALFVDVLIAEYLSLLLPLSTPWMLLGHTQALALPFTHTVEIGGVLLLTAWVLALNASLFFALESRRRGQKRTWADRGIAVASFAALLVVSAVYGTVRSGADTPPGHVSVGIAQPLLTVAEWEDPQDAGRVAQLASVSDELLAAWATQEAAGAGLKDTASRARYRGPVARPDLLIWPRSALPVYGDLEREQELYTRLATWSERRRTPLLTGAFTAGANAPDRTTESARYYPIPRSASRQSALMFHPAREGVVRYDQSRRVPVLEAVPSALARGVGDAVPAFEVGGPRRLLPAGRTHLAASVGYESVYGDHIRRFVSEGAGMLVALAPASGGFAGRRQHLAIMRLRALETGRAVVVAAAGESSLVLPNGRAVDLVSTSVPEGVRVDVPVHTRKTLYVRFGDWLGQLALVAGLLGHLGLWYMYRMRPRKKPRRVEPLVTMTVPV